MLHSTTYVINLNLLFQCASAIDNLCTFYFNCITLGESPNSPAALSLAQHIAEYPGFLPEVSFTFFIEKHLNERVFITV